MHRLAVGNLIFAVPHHRAVPGTILVVAVVGGQERELVAGATQRQATVGRPVRQLDIREHPRRKDRSARKVGPYRRAGVAAPPAATKKILPPPVGSTIYVVSLRLRS